MEYYKCYKILIFWLRKVGYQVGVVYVSISSLLITMINTFLTGVVCVSVRNLMTPLPYAIIERLFQLSYHTCVHHVVTDMTLTAFTSESVGVREGIKNIEVNYSPNISPNYFYMEGGCQH